MRHQSIHRARIGAIAAAIASLAVSAFGQTGHSLSAAAQAQAAQAAPALETVKRLSIDEAQKLALEQNLGIQIQRLDPQIQDVGVAQARSFWSPQISTTLSKQSQTPAVHELYCRLGDQHRRTATSPRA